MSGADPKLGRMIDTRIFFFNIDPAVIGHQRFWAPAWFHDSGFLAQQGEGWVPVSYQLIPSDDGLVIGIMCNREIPAGVPEDL